MSKSAHKNPYRQGSKYHSLFGMLQSKQVTTRSAMIAFAKETLGINDTAAAADVTVVLSPRESTNREGCDPRGNFSSQGHLYFVQPIKAKGEELRFRLRWRETPLSRRTRSGEPLKRELKAATAPADVPAPAPKKAKKAKAKKAKKPAAVETPPADVTAPVDETPAQTTAPETVG